MKIENTRLLKVFDQSIDYFYNNKKNLNQKSKHWQKFNANKKFNLNNLINFRSSKSNLSYGMDDQKSQIYIEDFKNIPESYITKMSNTKNIGNNNNLIKYKNHLIDYNSLIHFFWFKEIESELFLKNKISNLCEIGGGFGSFAELFIRNYNTKLLSIDLPEANLITAYYLKESFPEKKFFLFDDYKVNNFLSLEDYNDNDVIILPPNSNLDSKIKIDFFVNARSMMEMEFKIINSYFQFIHNFSHKNSYFLNINRYEKRTAGEKIRIAEYPYDKNWKVIISNKSINQNHIHFLLTKRTFNPKESDINEELSKINNIGKKYYEEDLLFSQKFFSSKFFFLFVNKIIKFFKKLRG